MTIKLLIPALAAAALVAACDKQDHTIVNQPGSNQPAPASIDPATLPPPILASKTYRCKDNSLVYIDWLGDKTSANLKTSETGRPTMLKAAVEGEAMVAEGYSLTGSATSPTITLTLPGKGSASCKA